MFIWLSDPEPKNHSAHQEGFLVNTEGCRIPDLDPMDSSVSGFIEDDTPVECSRHYGPALLESNLTSIYLVESALVHYNVNDINSLYCCFKPFHRMDDKEFKWVMRLLLVNFQHFPLFNVSHGQKETKIRILLMYYYLKILIIIHLLYYNNETIYSEFKTG